MYAKHFASMYTGSMRKAGPLNLAVWGWVLSHANPDGQVEINPDVLVDDIGHISATDVEAAVQYLEATDDRSRSPEDEGRRIVHEGAFLYRIVNHQRYREMQTPDERRAYMRDAQRRSRARRQEPPPPVNAECQSGQNSQSATHDVKHTDTDTDTDTENNDGAALGRNATRRRRLEEVTGLPVPVDRGAVSKVPSYGEILSDVLGSDQRLRTAQLRHAGLWALFSYWGARTEQPGAFLDVPRYRKLEAHLKVFPLSQLFFTIDGCLTHPHQQDRESGERYLQLHQVFKDADRIENRAKHAGYAPGKEHPMVAKYPKLRPLEHTDG